MNKYIVTCVVNGGERSALVFDTRRAATSSVKRIVKSLGAKIKFKQRTYVDWNVSKHGIDVAFRLIIVDEEDISYILKSAEADARHFATRGSALKHAAKSLYKVAYLKGSGAGKWYTTKAGKETTLHLVLTIDSESRNADYNLLGIKKGATDAEIKKAYRNKVKSAHPDHGGTEQDMKDLNEAYKNITSGHSDPDEKTQEFNSVSAQFLSHRLFSILNNRPSSRQTIQFGLRQITLGVSLIVFSVIVTSFSGQSSNPGAIDIIATALFIFGAYYLTRGIVNSVRK